MEVELTCPVVRTVDQEGRESNIIAGLVGSQESVLEESCTNAVPLCASIYGKTCKEKNGTRVRASTGFEDIWEFAAFYCSRRQGVETKRLWFLPRDENASISGAVVLPCEAVEPIVDLGVARLESRSVVFAFKRTRFLQNCYVHH